MMCKYLGRQSLFFTTSGDSHRNKRAYADSITAVPRRSFETKVPWQQFGAQVPKVTFSSAPL